MAWEPEQLLLRWVRSAHQDRHGRAAVPWGIEGFGCTGLAGTRPGRDPTHGHRQALQMALISSRYAPLDEPPLITLSVSFSP